MSGKEKQGKRRQAGLKQDQTSCWCLFCFPFVAPALCPFAHSLLARTRRPPLPSAGITYGSRGAGCISPPVSLRSAVHVLLARARERHVAYSRCVKIKHKRHRYTFSPRRDRASPSESIRLVNKPAPMTLVYYWLLTGKAKKPMTSRPETFVQPFIASL
jgi:hypothetical protein